MIFERIHAKQAQNMQHPSDSCSRREQTDGESESKPSHAYAY